MMIAQKLTEMAQGMLPPCFSCNPYPPNLFLYVTQRERERERERERADQAVTKIR